MSIFEDTNPRELKDLLRQIDQRESALPDFQRDFVWDPSATQELIVSIASNYPAGSLLRIRNTHELFAHREFQGAPALNGHMPTYLVLDGQQRLTSLYQAFYGVGDHRYFLDLRGLLDGKDFEECIFHLRATHRRVRELDESAAQANQLVLPLSVLKGGIGGFGQWTLAAVKTLAKQEGADAAAALAQVQELGEIQANWIQAIDDYRFPVVTLSDRTGADAVCTIFETLNRTGVKLSPFELLTARFWPQNINLRELWANATAEHPIIEDMEIDPYYVLQSISLVARRTPSCKRSDVLDLTANDITKWWDLTVRGLAEGLRILRDDCGVLVPKWLPYAAVVIPLAAVLARQSDEKGPQVAASRAKLVRWYWCSTIGQSYENGPNSQAAKDVNELSRWLDNGEPPESVAGFRFDSRLLQATTSRQRGLYRAAMGLILRQRPRDFYKGEHITGDLMIERHIDDHHVFPDAFLRKQDIQQRLRDCILNRTLIDRQTNKSISDSPPSTYLPAIHKTLEPVGSLDALLSSHLLPTGDDSPFHTDDFEAFLVWREARMWGEIREVTGLHEASDLAEISGEEQP